MLIKNDVRIISDVQKPKENQCKKSIFRQLCPTFTSKFALTNYLISLYYYLMPQIVAILFEEKIEESYIAIKLEGEEPEILFTKGPDFSKTMVPYPVPYAEATFKRWYYCLLENPPEINLNDKKSILDKMVHILRQSNNTAKHCPEYL